MPKRKLADLAEPPAPQSLQAIRLSQKFDQSVIVLSRAFKAARISERQKMGRREKTAKAQPGSRRTLARLAEEVQVLKTLDFTVAAKKHIFKQLSRTKRIAESTTFAEFQQSRKLAAGGPSSEAEANVMGLLCKSTPVKNVLPGIMDGIREIMGLDDMSAAGKKGSQAAKGAQKKDQAKPKRSERPTTADEDEDEEEGEPRAIAAGDDSDDDMDLAQYSNQLASDSESDSESSRPPRNAMSISPSRSPSPTSPPQKQQKAQPRIKPTTTTFLPSLTMGGYFSGSESEPEDAADSGVAAPRKNRMGQQARRALWEKKYGTGANHVKQEQAMARRSRDNGWDMKRGATGGERRHGGGRGGYDRGDGRSSFPSRNGGDGNGHMARKPPPPQDNKPLHPSWEAAKKAKEQKNIAAFQGKKMVFD
ncbi:BUD22 family protein [Aspergillus candidus]|uniref:Bud-site selection protein n=1 Tax=Aspergillus candidus TaxID=41067 RepID=A0A2I2FG33_ASPCN|nr:Bud-site selection protein [Aspergillus candidus]PLB39596.1 Bud-site selection protein [Aspergillus candidus]